MNSSWHDEWSDSDDGKEHNRRNKKCKISESAEDPENTAMPSVQTKAGTSGLHKSNRLQQQQKRKISCSNDAQLEQSEIKRGRKKSNDGESQLDNHLSTNFEKPEVHPSSGLKTSLHGVAYQLKLLMLCLKRGIDQGYPFRITTEMDEAEKFDDLVFQYKVNGEILLRFLQAKHKLDESEKISIRDLLTETDKKLNLQKYFNSYCKIKRNPKFINKNSRIKDLIICTNIGFKLGDKRGTLTLSNEIFDTEKDETILKTKLLRFRKDFPGREEIVSVLRNAPDVMRLAKDLVDRVPDDQSTGKKEKSELLELYQFALVKEVIDDGSKKFQRKFVTDAENLTAEARHLRKVFEKVFKDSKTGKKMCPDMNNFRQVIGEKKLSLSNDFGILDAELSNIGSFVKELVSLIMESRNNNDPYVEMKAKNFKTSKNKDKLAKYTLIEENNEIRFRDEFFSDALLPGNLNEFREQLEAQVKDLKELRFVIKNFPKSGLPSITDIDSDIDSFLDKLLFAVNQPNEMKLSSFIDAEMRVCTDINLIDTEYLVSRFQKYLFDWMKDKKGRFLTYVEGKRFFDEMRKTITTLQLTGLTREYSAEMKEMDIRFTEVKIELQEFLEPENTIQLFILISMPNIILGRIQVYQTLEKKSDYQKDDAYIYIRLDSLSRMQGPVIDAFGSRTGNLLIIEYKSIEARNQTSYRKLLEVVKSNDLGKIILITDNDNKLVDTLKSTFSDRCKAIKIEVNGLPDLANKSQKKLLEERRVKFQGQEVSLSDLIVDEESKKLINAEALSKLINNEALEIGKPLQDLGDVGNYYIRRTFQRREKIDRSFLDNKLEFYVTTNDQLMDFDPQPNQDIVVISDNDEFFKELGNKENYKKHNIHWLKPKNRHFEWQESKGALSNLRNFVDRKSVKSFVPEKVTDVSEKVVIIAAEPGMGKSTLLTHLSLKTKKLKPTVWVARVNLSSDCSGKLEEMAKKEIRFDNEKTIDFLLASAKFTSKMLEYEFLKYCYKTGNMILLFDGFDEISPNYKDEVIELFKFLKSTKVETIWVTTRPYGIETHLEDELGSFSYELQEFTEKEQKLFLKNYWKAKLNPDNFTDKHADFFINTLFYGFSELINDNRSTTDDRERRFISIPLQIEMIAVIFQDTFRNFDNSSDGNNSDLIEKLVESLELLSLYEKFFDVKFQDIYFGEKRPGFDRTTTYNKLTMARERVTEMNNHEILALQNLYPNNSMIPRKEVAILIDDIKQSKNKIEIIDRVIDDRPVFVHQSFAEYFVALWFSKNWQQENVKQFLMKHIVNEQSVVILDFLDRILAKDEPESSQTLESGSKYPEGANKYKLHKAVLDNDVSEVERLLNKDKSLLDTTDNAERTPVHLAAARGYIKIAQSLLKEVEESAYHSKNHPLSVKDELFQWTPLTYADENNHWDVAELLLQMGAASEEMFKTERDIKKVGTLLHKAAEEGYLKIAEYLIRKGVMIDAQDEKGRTPLCLAAIKGRLEMVKYLVDEKKANFEAVDGTGYTPLHIAAYRGHLDVVEYLVDEKKANFEAVDGEGRTPLHYGALDGHLDVVKYLVDEKKANFEAVNGEGRTPLHYGALDGHLDVVKYLVDEKKANFEAVDGRGRTPLHPAALNGHLDMVKYLVDEKKANFEAVDGEGRTPLHPAALNGHLDVVKYLVDEKKANFEAVDGRGRTPLHYGAYKGHLDMVKYLVDEKKANFEAVDGEGRTPLHYGALDGHLDVVKYLVDEKKANFVAVDGDGRTPLHPAALNGHLDMVKYLVDEKKANFEAVDGEGRTPLYPAALNGHLDMVKYLVDEKKANFEAVDGEGCTSLHSAALDGHLDVVKYLVDEKKANFEAVDGRGRTPLHPAALNGHLDMVKYLVDEKKANFEAVDGEGRTPLHPAALNGHLDVVKYLVDEKKANFEAVDGRGRTPLHYGAYKGHLDMVKYLVDEKKANFEAVDGEGRTPLHYGALDGHLDVVKYLVDEKKANFEAVDGDGRTPLHPAALNGHLDMVKYLVDEKKANFEAVDGEGRTPLYPAALNGHLDMVKYLVDEKKANFEAVDGEGCTSLHSAALNGHLDVVKYLVDEKKANFEAVDGEGCTPLHPAALNGHLDMVKYLVDEKKANFEAVDGKGRTPLHPAALNGHLDMVKYLVDEKKANFEAVDGEGRTPLHYGAYKGHLDMVKYLVHEKKANFEAVDGKGMTPLHYGALDGHLDVVEYLVDEEKANSEAVDGEGHTPLHIATMHGNLKIV